MLIGIRSFHLAACHPYLGDQGLEKIMGNHRTLECRGSIPLYEGVKQPVRHIMQKYGCEEDPGGYPWNSWSFGRTDDGQLRLDYHQFAEGNYSVRDGQDWERAFEALTATGLSTDAWEEESHWDSENGGPGHTSHLRGSPEQMRSYRLKQIDEEIVNLKAERERLLEESLAA